MKLVPILPCAPSARKEGDHFKMSNFFLPEKTTSQKQPKRRLLKKTDLQPKAKISKPNRKSRGSEPRPRKSYNINDNELENYLDEASSKSSDSEGSGSEEETAQEKRIRLTKQYLAQLEEEEKDSEAGVDHDAIAHRLKQDVLEQSGKLQKRIAHKYLPPSADSIRVLRGHQLSPTCVCVSSDNKFAFSGSKDCCIIKWNIETGKREGKVIGGPKGESNKSHSGHILCLAIATDGKFLASGGRDKVIHIWHPSTLEHIHTFKGHKDAVSGVAFRHGTHQLFSASHDRTVKIWNLDEMGYVETLYGHQDCVTGIDSLSRDRAVTSGGRDRTLRVWKIMEESQLVFNGHGCSNDCIQLINEDHFVTGADDGSISVWSLFKKKPLCIEQNAHSKSKDCNNDLIPDESWIASLATVRSSDLFASGSCDTCIKLWQCSEGFKKLTHLFSIPVNGFVNGLAFSSDGGTLIAAVGQEHRLGRWWRLKNARNSIVVIPLLRTEENGLS